MIVLKNLKKNYILGKEVVEALRGVDLHVDEGEFIAIMGPSGSGKSTLMNMLGLLDNPTSGTYMLYNKDVSKLSQYDQSTIRGKEIGFIFQQYNLIARMSALQQVILPLEYQNVSYTESKIRAIKALERVGLGDKLSNKPTELSGGQQQRVAIARALVIDPKIILADEPTGALDSVSGRDVMEIISKLHKEGCTIIMITHELEVAEYAQKIIHIRDGVIVEETHKKINKK